MRTYRIEYHTDHGEAFTLGTVQIPTLDEYEDDSKPKLKLLDHPNASRSMTAARAVFHRLQKANPRTLKEIEAFKALEGSEVRLGSQVR